MKKEGKSKKAENYYKAEKIPKNYFIDYKVPIMIGSTILIIFALIINYFGSGFYLSDEIGFSPGCTDSDGGKIHEVKGVTTLSTSQVSKTDVCSDEKTLREYYCDQTKKVRRFLFFSRTISKEVIDTYTIRCDKLCVEGACVDKINENTNLKGYSEYVISSVDVDDSSEKTMVSINVYDKKGFGTNGGKLKIYNPASGAGGFIPSNVLLDLVGGSNSKAIFNIGGGDLCPGVTFKMVLDDSLSGNDEVDFAKEYDAFTISLICDQGKSKCSKIIITGEYPEFGEIEQDTC